MKYLKTYENTIENITDKIIKLSEKFVIFFNDINPKLKCYYQIDKSDSRIMNYEKSLLLLSNSNNYLIRIILLYDINYYFSKKEIKTIDEFLKINLNDEYLSKAGVDEFIEYLTKENYEKFLISKISNKYNI